MQYLLEYESEVIEREKLLKFIVRVRLCRTRAYEVFTDRVLL